MWPSITNYTNRCFGFSAFVCNLCALSEQGRGPGTNLFQKTVFMNSTSNTLFMKEFVNSLNWSKNALVDMQSKGEQ